MATMRKKARRLELQKEEDDQLTDTIDWAGLPEGIVDAISKCLPLLCVISMGAVCKSWRLVLSEEVPSTKSRGLPWLMLCGQNNCMTRTCWSLLENKVWKLELPIAFRRYCWGSTQDWLIVVENRGNCQIDIFFLNPFLSTTINLPATYNLYCKMVLSTSPNDPDCVIILVGGTCTWIACWTQGAQEWQRQHLGAYAVVDAVFCNGKFYFLSRDYNIRVIDAKSIISAMKEGHTSKIESQLYYHQVEFPNRPSWTCLRRYLVESCGEVLLVCRSFEFEGDLVTRNFEVFNLDIYQKVWRKMESLGERILFIGKSDSRSFLAKELGVGRGNCIYFFRNDPPNHKRNEWSWKWKQDDSSPRACCFDNWGVFSLDGNCFTPDSCNHVNLQYCPPIWITAPIWWCIRNSKH